jgi:uncharacterized membrane protein YphA (DoxX/SURF4 family)
MHALWTQTQTPELHEKWDLRFSTIEYLPRIDEASPQRFRYVTRIGFGFEIAGEGETVGEASKEDGTRTSALRFSSRDRRSLIREGSGYWKYIQTASGIRFLTWYDYETRFGGLGMFCDRVLFRPLMGWATAWSFDRLRLRLERGLDPARAAGSALVHALARFALAFVFLYHGIVPKLLGPHADELTMMRNAGMSSDTAAAGVMALGAAEVAIGLCLLLLWIRRWPLAICVGGMCVATASVALTSPVYFSAAFNPASLNVAVVCLALIDWVILDDVPSASRCRRRPLEATP